MSDGPVKSDDISLKWLNQILPGEIGQDIEDFSVEIVGEGVGVLGELARIRLSLKDGTSLNVIAKFSSVQEATREFSRAMGFYEAEINFYQSLAEDTPLRTPHIYHQAFDPETYQFVIVMEEARGVIGDQVEGCTAADAILVVSELARLHCAWNDIPKLDAITWLRPINSDGFMSVNLAQLKINLPLYLERFPEFRPDWLEGMAEEMPPLVSKCADFFNSKPHSLIHGDYRLDNMAFEANGGGKILTVIDWQLVFRTMPSYDLGYFMFQSLDVEVRRSCEKELVETYVAARKAGGNPTSVEEVYSELPYICFFCTIYPIIAGGLIDLEKPRSRPLIKAMSDRAFMAMEDHNSMALAQAL